MRKLVFVHGRAQQGKSSELLKNEWLDALQNGLAKGQKKLTANPDVPLYGNRLQELSERSTAIQVTSNDAELLRHPDQIERDEGFEAFIQQAAEDAASTPAYANFVGVSSGSDAPLTQHPDRLLRTVRNSELEERGLQNSRLVRLIVQHIDSESSKVSELTIRSALRDVYNYVTRESVQEEIDTIVKAQITTEPTVIVAHSLGTIVAYNILHRLEAQHPSNVKLVTVGSPLGIQAIRQRLEAGATFPRKAESWFNAFDTRDIVALNSLVGTSFFGSKPKKFSEYMKVDNFTENRHGIAGYLSDQKVAKSIMTFLEA